MRRYGVPALVLGTGLLLATGLIMFYGPVTAEDDLMVVDDIRLEPQTLLLESGCYMLTMGVSNDQLQSIQMAQANVTPHRPLTHDLLLDVLDVEGGGIESVVIHSMVDGSYRADIVTHNGNRIDARPSDAVAVSIRAEADIFIDRALMRDVGLDTCDRPEDAFQL